MLEDSLVVFLVTIHICSVSSLRASETALLKMRVLSEDRLDFALLFSTNMKDVCPVIQSWAMHSHCSQPSTTGAMLWLLGCMAGSLFCILKSLSGQLTLSYPVACGTDGSPVMTSLENTCIKWCSLIQLLNALKDLLGKLGFETYSFAIWLFCLWSSISSTYFRETGERCIYNSFISCILRNSEGRHPKCTAVLLIACFYIGS